MFENKKIFILGMARSGFEAAKLLLKYNNEIVITDAKEQDADQVEYIEKLGAKVVITENQDELIDDTFDYMIKNPGIKYDNKCVLKALSLGIKVVNEMEMAYSFLPKNINIIGVTGSNGKTTTVTLIYEILKKAEKNVHLCGNIGFPLSSMIPNINENDILVVEISDHQLCDMYDFKTNISVLTNISETHIDFHDSYDRYKMIKKRIFNNHTKNDIAVINYNNSESIQLTNDISSKKLYFSNDSKQNCYMKDNYIYYKDDKVIKVDEIKVKGIHNYENIMASIIVSKEYNVSDDAIREVLVNFKGVEHRIEYVTKINDILFYNDSKSTNNKAVMTALSSFNNHIILIMGGLDRGQTFDELNDYMKNVKKIVCYGETKNRIKEFAVKYNYDCTVVDNLKEATKIAYNFGSKNDVILLSPGCASWDQYKCFEDRGNEFKKTILEIEEK